MLQWRWFFPCQVDCTHQIALPPVCVAGDHLPCALQHAKRAFSLKEHSWVHLFKDNISSGKLRRYVFVKTSWQWVMVTIAASQCLGSKHTEDGIHLFIVGMSHLFNLGVAIFFCRAGRRQAAPLCGTGFLLFSHLKWVEALRGSGFGSAF